ncbi:protein DETOXIFICATION 11-like [Hibiscus syriacus]|uniref:protein DETOXIFICATION 11-like n=1 Tax=Hibiscus syriacus TaxID=106335 RepID=UPI00192082F1|nr:protein DETOXIFICATION 11-like [Hibiscus syriacus]
MACALETLCGQAYGAQQYRKVGIHTYTAIFCLILVCIPLSPLWLYMGRLLIFSGQDPLISHEASKFVRWLIPALFAYAAFQPLVRYFQTQSLITPLLICFCISLLVHIPLCWALVFKFGLDTIGGALAISISSWLNVIFLALYMWHSPTSLNGGWWSFELLILLSGLLPNPHLEISVLSVCLNTISTLYAIPYGLGAATSIEKEVVDYVTTMTPLVCVSVILDSLQGVLQGDMDGSM